MFHFWRKCEECVRDEPHGCLFVREDGHEIFRICAGCDFSGIKCPSAQALSVFDGVCVECDPPLRYEARVLTKKKEPEAPSSSDVDCPSPKGASKELYCPGYVYRGERR
jgi:hypothetical protein